MGAEEHRLAGAKKDYTKFPRLQERYEAAQVASEGDVEEPTYQVVDPNTENQEAAEAAWGQVLEVIKGQVPALTFATYLQRTEGHALDVAGGVLQVVCPSAWVAQAIERRLYGSVAKQTQQVVRIPQAEDPGRSLQLVEDPTVLSPEIHARKEHRAYPLPDQKSAGEYHQPYQHPGEDGPGPGELDAGGRVLHVGHPHPDEAENGEGRPHGHRKDPQAPLVLPEVGKSAPLVVAVIRSELEVGGIIVRVIRVILTGIINPETFRGLGGTEAVTVRVLGNYDSTQGLELLREEAELPDLRADARLAVRIVTAGRGVQQRLGALGKKRAGERSRQEQQPQQENNRKRQTTEKKHDYRPRTMERMASMAHCSAATAPSVT